MKNQRALILALIFTLLTSIFAMSDDGNNEPTVVKKEVKSSETVKDQFGVDTGMTMNEYEQFKRDYLDYQKSKKIKGNRALYTKFNLLKVSEFKEKYNIDFNRLLDMCNLNDFIARSELIIVGTFDSVEIAREKKSRFPVTFKVKVDEVISNGTEYEIIPEYITVKEMNISNMQYDKLLKMKKGLVGKKELYMMFLTRADFFEYKNAYDTQKTKYYTKEDCFLPYTFTNLYNSLRKLEDERFNDINKFKARVKGINDLNDKNNFYKRSYK